MGETPNETELLAVDTACEALVDELYDSDDTGYPMYSLKSMIGALHAIGSTNADAALEAAFNAGDAANSADFQHQDGPMLEETDWQLNAADVAASTDRMRRDMFSHLASNPKWLQEFRRKN